VGNRTAPALGIIGMEVINGDETLPATISVAADRWDCSLVRQSGRLGDGVGAAIPCRGAAAPQPPLFLV